MSSGKGFANALEAASTSFGPDKRHITLSIGTAKRLAEYIYEISRFSLGGRTPGDEQRLSNDAHGLVSLEDELEIALAVEEEAVLEEVYITRAGVSLEIPTGIVQTLPPPPATQAEVIRSPFRKTFKHSQCVKINGLFDVGRFASADGEKVQRMKYRRLKIGAHFQRK